MITDMNRFQISPAYSKYKEKILIRVFSWRLSQNWWIQNFQCKAVSHQITGRSSSTI